MADVFRIIELFHITNYGNVYLLDASNNANIRVGDLLFDLRGNRFKVSGIEMIRKLTGNVANTSIGITFKFIDKVEVQGNILVRDVYDVNFIFCNHPLYRHRVDKDYEEEYQAAGLHHPCALFSFEDMEDGKLSLYGEDIQGLTIYRGWMMKPEMYRKFYHALESQGVILINTPEEYERYHLLPGWYQDFKEWTIESEWENEGNLESIIKMAKHLEGAYIVKDFVKSRKHEWYDACFISDISDEVNVRKVIGNFIERQGNSLVGGVVLRKFIHLRQNGFHERSGMPISEEYRIFIYAGKVLILDKYWNTDQEAIITDAEYMWIEEICKKIRSNFVSLDLARTIDGKLIVMEMGDGQVSGLQQIQADCFYEKFPYSIPIEELIPEDTVIIAEEPLPNISPEEVHNRIENIVNVQQLVDMYVDVHNKFWFIEDEIYDYDEGTEEYLVAKQKAEVWEGIMEILENTVVKVAKEEGLLVDKTEKSGLIHQIVPFMNKYGYIDGRGWWVKR